MRRLLWLLIVIGCGSKTDSSDAQLDELIADVMAYGDKTVPMMATWGGDCDALADKMLTMESLADEIRVRTAAIEADPARKAKLQAKKKETMAKVMAHYDELLKPLGKTTADIDKAEVAIKQLCSSNPKYKDAEQRVGLKVRARHEAEKP